MRRFGKILLPVLAVIWVWLLPAGECHCSPPAQIRMTLRTSAERMGELTTAYEARRAEVVSVLGRYGLIESPVSGRVPAPTYFTRIFEVGSPSDLRSIRTQLASDSDWKALLQEFVTAGMSVGSRGAPAAFFRVYSTPAMPGDVVAAGPGQGHWRTFSISDGLPGSTVKGIMQDRDRNIWFATSAGASCYDGREFSTYTNDDGLPSNDVRFVLEDSKGELWVGTGGGAARFDGRVWETASVDSGLQGREVQWISEDARKHLWFATIRDGVREFDGETWTTYAEKDGLASNWVNSVLLDRDGILWFCGMGGVTRYDRAAFTNLRARGTLPSPTVRQAIQDEDGDLWFTTSRGACRYDGEALIGFPVTHALGGTDLWPVFRDTDGKLWFGSAYYSSSMEGVTCFDGEAAVGFSTEDGLAGNAVGSVFQDDEGYMWFGTWGQGVSRFDNNTFLTFTTEQGLPSSTVHSVVQDREGSIWIGTRTGLARYDGKTFTTFSEEQGLPSDWVRRLTTDNSGDLWVGTSGGGVCKFDGRSWSVVDWADGINAFVYALCVDKNGHLWAGTFSGAYRFDGESVTGYKTEDGLADNAVNAILEDSKGHLWFATNNGLSQYDGERFTNYTVSDGLPGNVVTSCLNDREGNLWFGTDNGLTQYDGTTWRTYTTAHGLASNRVYAIFQDRAEHLWFGTDAGVSRYDGDVFQILTEGDGLASNQIEWITQDRQGRIWLCPPDGGVTCYTQPAPVPPEVTVDGVVADRRYSGVSALGIPSTVGMVAFEYHGISPRTRADGMVYRYQLTGHDGGWQTTRAERVEYHGLPTGKYTFKVLAVDRDLVYSDAPATVALTVHQPYERIGLLSLLGIAVVTIFWQTFRVIRRGRSLRESNRALSDGNRELFAVTRQLQRDRAVERVRAEVTAMQRASDFEKVLAVLAEDMKQSGLVFEVCSIDVLVEPVDTPTLPHFEQHSFSYTNYRLSPEGLVSQERYDIPAPFPEVLLGAIERFVAGEVWQGRDMDLGAIVEVPIAQYGRLRLSASSRESFEEEDAATLQEFTAAIALGYTRSLDFQDLETKNRRLEELDAAKTDFLSGVAHELGTPMTAIKGYIDNLLDGIAGQVAEGQARYLTRIRSNADRLTRMVSDLLDLSRIDRGRADLIDLSIGKLPVGEVVQATVEDLRPLADERNLALTVEADDVHGMADRDRLTQVVTNLVANAIKFTETGEVTVTVRADGEGNVRTTVRDTGRGIPADSLNRVFERLYQVRDGGETRQGSGLGLAISKEFVELMGGKIWVESEVGRGSVFAFTVPVA